MWRFKYSNTEKFAILSPMPRKTRKQKRRAATRIAKLSPVQTSTIASPMTPLPIEVPAEETAIDTPKKVRFQAPARELSEQDIALRKYTVRDVVKTIIIISLLFGTQAALYFARTHGYLEKFF